MIQVFLLFRGKWTVVWRKKIYTDSQHNMQEKQHKINMLIIGTLGQITKASFRDSGLNQFILVQVTQDEQSSAAWLHITHIKHYS